MHLSNSKASKIIAACLILLGCHAQPQSPGINTEPLLQRIEVVSQGYDSITSFYKLQVQPVERLVAHANPRDARTIAWSVVLISRKQKIPIDLMVGLLLTENPDFLPSARSSAGAIGLAQVMPEHVNGWPGCKGKDLRNIKTNICYGASILRQNMNDASSIHEALLLYNGCSPTWSSCNRYPYWVQAKAKWARKMMYRSDQ